MCVQCRGIFTGRIIVCPHDGNMLVAVPAEQRDPLLGVVLGDRYEILEIAGKGGMGIVYKARHLLIDRIVAIKVLKGHLLDDEQSLLRFQVEARAASRLNHPNVVAVHDFGVTDWGQPYLVMDYVQGENLSAVLGEAGPLDFRRAVPIFIQACNALEHAHRQQIIHRDVKPSNITLLQTEGQPDFVKVLDFGIAKLINMTGESLQLTKTGEVFGSPLYMSPEQCTGSQLDPRTDVYSLGAAMYEALVGFPPHQGQNAMETISKQVNEQPRPFTIASPHVAVPEAIEAIVFKALEKDRNQRFQSMLEMKEALEAAMKGTPIVTRSRTDTSPVSQATSEFSGVDLRKEIQREVPVSRIQVEKLQAKGKAARLLGADKESGSVEVNRLKSLSAAPQRFPVLPVIIAIVLILALAAAAAWFLLHQGR
jgi:serine/threonine-protein kinase